MLKSGERLLTFVQAAKHLPPAESGRHLSPSTIWRWARIGIRGVKLEIVAFGRRYFTTAEALDRFSRRLAERAPAPAEVRRERASKPRTEAQRRRDIQRAESELKKAGV